MRVVGDEDTEYSSQVENEMIQEIILFVLDILRKRLELIGGIDIEKA